jgi:hypothetical protein
MINAVLLLFLGTSTGGGNGVPKSSDMVLLLTYVVFMDGLFAITLSV